MQRELASNPCRDSDQSWSLNLLDDHRLIAVQDSHVGREFCSPHQVFQKWLGFVSQLEIRKRSPAEIDEFQPEPVPSGVNILLEISTALQRRQNQMQRAFRDDEAPAHFRQ